MALTTKRDLFVDIEQTYGTDDSTDGSGYLFVPALKIGELKDGLRLLDTNYQANRPYPTAPIAGPDGWSFDVTVPLIGLSAAAGDGTAASAAGDDWLDYLLMHIFGAQASSTGEGVASSADSTHVTLDTDPYSVQQLMAIYESGVPSAAARTQWELITVDPGDNSYTIAPALAATISGAAVAYGVLTYTPNIVLSPSAASLAFVYNQDDQMYLLLGGRCTSCSIKISEPGAIAEMSMTFEGDTKTETSTATKSALPNEAVPTSTPIHGVLSPVFFGGTAYATKSMTIDFGIEAAAQGSTAAANGRAAFLMRAMAPKITIEPLFSTTHDQNKRAATTGRLLVQLGAGVLASSQLNTICVHAEEATCTEATILDDDKRQRQTVIFTVTDKIEFSSGVDSQFLQLARA